MTKIKGIKCSGCPLEHIGYGYAPWGGTGSNKVLLLKDYLNGNEVSIGVPFAKDIQLSLILDRVGYRAEQFKLGSLIRCVPPKKWHLMNECSKFCADAYLQEDIDKVKPVVIVSMGMYGAEYFIQRNNLDKVRGYVYKTQYGTVIPTYDTSYVMKGNKNLTDVVSIDIRRALRVVREGYKEPEYSYIEHPSNSDLWDYWEDCKAACAAGRWLAADIETPMSGGVEEDELGEITDSVILRMSFSHTIGTAITLPFTQYNHGVIKAILELPWEYTIFHNANFDVPRLRANGFSIGTVLDSMYMFHWLQSDLPKNLGFVSTFFTELSAWKHLSQSNEEYYSAKDAAATIEIAYKIAELLKKQGRWEWFIKHYVELMPWVNIIARSGTMIDMEQQDKFRKVVDAELRRIDDEIQREIPVEVRRTKLRKRPDIRAVCGEPVRVSDPSWLWDIDSETGEFIERQNFLYNSSKQAIGYMRFRGHKVPTNYKTGKDTSSADEIEKLANKYPDDPLYVRLLGAREARKIIGTYIDGKYKPDGDGRIRTHYDKKPSTMRFNSYNCNLQNYPKRGEFAKEYRKQFIAGEVND